MIMCIIPAEMQQKQHIKPEMIRLMPPATI
jgi:hypothetical protein